MHPLWSPLARNLHPYVPGEQPQQKNIIKLNTNENPYPPSPMVIEAIKKAADAELRKYPDPESTLLKTKAADLANLTPSHVFVGNGSDEVLGILFFALFKKPKPVLFPDITYSFYSVYSRLVEIKTIEPPLKDDFTIDWSIYHSIKEEDIGGIIYPNPNAPTGIATSLYDLEQLLLMFPNTPIVVDEAYVEFGATTAVPLIDRYPNLVIVQTLSKSHSLAGLRVGFAFAQPPLIEALNRVKNSFNSYPIDRLAQTGAIAALQDQPYLKKCIAKIVETRTSTVQELQKLGFSCLDSQANFIFVTHPIVSAKRILKALSDHSIFVRHFAKPRIENYLRISIGTEKEMEAFVSAVTDIINLECSAKSGPGNQTS